MQKLKHSTFPQVMLEGNFWPSISVYSKEHAGGNWYDVPYKIMVPKRGQGANLLVPVALSASAVAFSSTRIENMYLLQYSSECCVCVCLLWILIARVACKWFCFGGWNNWEGGTAAC